MRINHRKSTACWRLANAFRRPDWETQSRWDFRRSWASRWRSSPVREAVRRAGGRVEHRRLWQALEGLQVAEAVAHVGLKVCVITVVRVHGQRREQGFEVLAGERRRHCFRGTERHRRSLRRRRSRWREAGCATWGSRGGASRVRGGGGGWRNPRSWGCGGVSVGGAAAAAVRSRSPARTERAWRTLPARCWRCSAPVCARRRCGWSGTADRMGRSRWCGKCDRARFCTWGGETGFSTRGSRAQTGTSRRTCKRRFPRRACRAPSCSGWSWSASPASAAAAGRSRCRRGRGTCSPCSWWRSPSCCCWCRSWRGVLVAVCHGLHVAGGVSTEESWLVRVVVVGAAAGGCYRGPDCFIIQHAINVNGVHVEALLLLCREEEWRETQLQSIQSSCKTIYALVSAMH